MSGVEGLVLGAITGAVVGEALGEVLKTVKNLVKRGKNFALLWDFFRTLEPLVVEMITLTGPDNPADPCLQVLYAHLKRAGAVTEEFKSLRKRDFLKAIPNSRKLVAVTEDIRSWLPTVAVAGLASNFQIVQTVEKLSQTVDELRNELTLQKVEEKSTTVLQSPTPSFGTPTSSMTPGLAFEQIRSAAGPASTPADSHGGGDSEATSSSTSVALKPAAKITVEDVVIGGDDLVEKAKSLLSADGESKWVAIWSMGGAGKTFTARRVYLDTEIRTHFVGGIFWLTVGRERTTLSLLEQLLFDITRERVTLSQENAKERVKRALEDRKRVLLILDDVWASTDLISLDVVGEYSSGNRILVTTRQKDLLDAVFPKKLEIPMLSPEHSWELFCWHAFHGIANVPPYLEKNAIKVMEECKGLALALKVIGGTMAGKSDSTEWKSTIQKLQDAETISEDHEWQVIHRLELSLEDLPAIHSRLLDCFYYFAAFPEDDSVDIAELVAMWVGEGIVERVNAFPKRRAYGLLGILVARSLIELGTGTPRAYRNLLPENLTCKVHDVLRDVARYRLQKKQEWHERECLYMPGRRLHRFPPGWMTSDGHRGTLGDPPLSVQRLSLIDNDLPTLPAEPLIAPALLVLLLGHNGKLTSLPSRFFSQLSHLRVLVMQNTAIAEIPDEVFRNLKSLVLLDLSHCHELVKIPASIQYLENLREFRLLNCSRLLRLPKEIGFLKSLETFSSYETDPWGETKEDILKHSSATVDIVNNWTELKDLSLSVPAEGIPLEFDQLKLLTNLFLFATFNSSIGPVSGLIGLESFRLYSNVLVLPPGLMELDRLQKLDLKGCWHLKSLPALDELPELEFLDLSYCRRLKSFPSSFGKPGAFPSLIILNMTGINESTFPLLQPGAMRLLADLSISEWPQLIELPETLQVLKNLRSLDLSGCTQLNSLESAFVPNSFPHLEQLLLKDAESLNRLPDSLASKSKLVYLDLRNCPAQHHLPADLQSCEDLKILTEPLVESSDSEDFAYLDEL